MTANGNGTGALVGFTSFLAGSFGFVNIPIVEVHLSDTARLGAGVLMVAGALVAAAMVVQTAPELPVTLGWFPNLTRMPVGHPWKLHAKRLTVTVDEGSGERRDATLEWSLDAENRARRRMARFDMPVVADVGVHRSRMDLRVHEPPGASVQVTSGGPLDPHLSILLPQPGADVGVRVPIRWSHRWPGYADIHGDCYFLRLADVVTGGRATIALQYTHETPVVRGEAFVARRTAGLWRRRRPLGVIPLSRRGDATVLEVTHRKERGDVFLLLYTLGVGNRLVSAGPTAL
jgi:hypothetical protein